MGRFFPIILFCCALVISCKKQKNITPLQTGLFGEVPAYFPEPVYTFQTDNSFSKSGFELGRKLFFDINLSKDNSISCASCHFQHAAFSDPGLAVSVGVFGRSGRRNSPPLFNLAWHPAFMWDGGINHIEVMPLAPLLDEHEMDMTLQELLEYLNNETEYQTLFKEVFNRSEITDQDLLYAFSQYMALLISADSRYDQYVQGKTSFSTSEQNGLALFNQHCSNCHNPPLFSTFSYANNGIGVTENDQGRYEITLQEEDKGKFKIPSLRNINLTYPYMHDGSISTLEEVIDHYSKPKSDSTHVSPELRPGFNFSSKEKQELLSFLNTLTDEEFITNKAYGEK